MTIAILPTKFSLSQQPSGRSGRQLAEYDTSAIGRGMQVAGRGIANLGGSIGEIADDYRRKTNTVDLARAEAAKAKGFLDTENAFSNDGDYSTFGQRAPKQTGDIVNKAADLIRDPAMRERWKIGAQTDALRVNDSIGDKARTLGKQAETNAFDDALETNRRIYVDPNTSDEAKAKARADIDGAIATGEHSGLLTPDQAASRRDQYIKNADFNRAKLAVEGNPKQFVRHSAVDSGIPPEGAALLDTIAGTESPDYNTMNGGEKFSDFTDHPRRVGKGGTATAAGRYQFVQGTWDRAKAATGVPDFSPDSQDKAGWWLAQADYKANTGRDLLSDLRSKDPNTIAGVRSALSSTWEGLKSLDDNKFNAKLEAGPVTTPAYFKNLSPEEQQVVFNQAETRQREMAVEQRGNIETVIQNAPAAIQNTGTYDGATPSRTEFMDAYGAQDGTDRYDKFTAAVDVSHQAFNFRTMSADDIQSAVNEAKPVSSGNGAAIETARYDMLSKAAETTLAARKADPATYTQQAFPNVARAWQDAATTGNYQAAMNVTAQAQQQLGIKNMALLPKQVADSAVAAFKNPDATDDQRLGAVNSLVFSTADPKQRQAVFKQMVDAGLPAMTEGAVEAAARGDTGAAKRLMQAALTDASKLPKSGDIKPADIDSTLYSNVWAPGSIGDATYGVGYGDAASLERAQRGGELMKKAVQLRISQGQDLNAAVAGSSKDLFGDKKVYDGAVSVHANLPVPSDTDENMLTNGLDAAKTSFKAALDMQRDRILTGSKAEVSDGGKAIIDQSTQNSNDDILENGVYVLTGDGVGLRDPYTGQFVPGPDGVTPLSLPLQAILDMGANRPQSNEVSKRYLSGQSNTEVSPTGKRYLEGKPVKKDIAPAAQQWLQGGPVTQQDSVAPPAEPAAEPAANGGGGGF
jgi:muramidase (phage lysozyme)